ncbi:MULTISPECIES: hypothetical protein [unclassified Coleofasciculus]|uniref:hypothetical protein n=1 Tax=unclassified Coleofasciculus TaxID=2692782 RepID=UPI00187E8018|nr:MULTISPECIES: hypothetical protein [unclassified Coleofasciculus]MBE9126011.1 hypothetical protein [Coleofasciculus sp. LEGE 07081]MBE9149386.1 hypothetical protein [Coleofasciculus sp. LEGE 07092]
MPVTIQTRHMGRFIDPWSYIALGAAGLVLLAFIVAQFFQKTLVSTTVSASEDEPAQLEAIQLSRQPIGALRIDVKALIPTNRWVTYEIQLFDQQGQVIASAIKEAWKESGTWYEEGESGSWSEEDTLGGLDVRAQKNEQVSIAVAVLEYGQISGQELDEPVQFKVTVQNGVVDTRYLLPGLIGAGSLALIAFMATPLSGKKAIAKTIRDSDPSGRGTAGGSDRLVRVKVDVKSDETSPRQLEVRLFINDAYGEQIYAHSLPMTLRYKKENGKVEEATGKVQAFFILEPRSSYGFHVEVMPDAPVDQTTLTVRDRTRTRQSVEVVQISPSPLDISENPQDQQT